MNSRSLLLCSMLAPLIANAQLEFTGSYWDTADSFRLQIDLTAGEKSLQWESSPLHPTEFKPDPNIRFATEVPLSQEEAALFSILIDHFSLCHSGYIMSLGTGLSIKTTLSLTGEGKRWFSYFGNMYEEGYSPRNAARMEEIPLLFESAFSDQSISEEERTKIFSALKEFTEQLQNHRSAIDLIIDSYQDNNPVDWNQVIQLSGRPYLTDPRAWQTAEREAEEVALILDAMFSEENSHHYFDSHPTSAVVHLSAPVATAQIDFQEAHADRQFSWVPYLPELNPILADFVVAPDFTRLRNCDFHKELKFALPDNWSKDEEVQKRISFLEESNLLTSLFEQSESSAVPIPILRVSSITFTNEQSRCVVSTWGEELDLYSLFVVENAEWKLLRVIDEKDWDEYGWKEPLFK